MSDITVASTTDELSDVRAAAGLPAVEEPTKEDSEEGTLTEVVEAESSEEVKQEAVDEGEDAELERSAARPKTSVQKRIDKLTAKNYQLSEEAEAARKENRDLAARLERLEKIAEQATKGTTTEPAKASEFSKPRPQSKDFDDYDKYTEALTDWKLEEKEFNKEQESKKTQAATAEARQKETFDAYNKAVSAARGEHEDFDEVVGREDLLVPMVVQAAIVGMRGQGPEVAYQLASDPELCTRLSEIATEDGDSAALVAFGKWVAVNFEDEQKPEPVVRKVAAKPAPIKPVGGSGTKSNVPMDELDYRDFRRIRDEQERASRRR